MKELTTVYDFFWHTLNMTLNPTCCSTFAGNTPLIDTGGNILIVVGADIQCTWFSEVWTTRVRVIFGFGFVCDRVSEKAHET